MIQVNALGDTCPMPVIKTMNALKELGGAGTVEVLVDNEIAVHNLTRLAENKGCTIETEKRSEKEYKDLIHRLNRIEGQIRGIRGMVEKEAYCPDILTQVAAASAALNSFSKVLLASHIKTCVAQDIRDGKDETIDELLTTLQKLMR